MIQFSNCSVFNFEGAFRGLRNPFESWKQSDSHFFIKYENKVNDLTTIRDLWMKHYGYGDFDDEMTERESLLWMKHADEINNWLRENSILDKSGNFEVCAYLGPKDLKLAQKLILAGSDESKFMRQIQVSVDITAPIYYFKEFDTYKISTTTNSTSTMHKLTSRPIKITDFSFDSEIKNLEITTSNIPHGEYDLEVCDAIEDILYACEHLRQKYVETKDKCYWRALIQLLPESYNQTRTWTANYAVLRNIYFARRNHKLSEWKEFCQWIETLPYGREFICLEEKKEK